MARVFKCDECGKFYEKGNVKIPELNENMIFNQIAIIDEKKID